MNATTTRAEAIEWAATAVDEAAPGMMLGWQNEGVAAIPIRLLLELRRALTEGK